MGTFTPARYKVDTRFLYASTIPVIQKTGLTGIGGIGTCARTSRTRPGGRILKPAFRLQLFCAPALFGKFFGFLLLQCKNTLIECLVGQAP